MTLVSAGAFAQGKISFQTDSLHLAYYDPSVGGALGGAAISSGNGANLVADMYMGTSSSSLSLLSSTTFSATPGKWTAASVIAPYAGGTTVYVVTQIRNTGTTAPAVLTPLMLQNADLTAAAAGFSWYGYSQEFTYPLNSSTYQPMWNSAGTWAAGTFALDATAGPGTKGAIAVFAVPEPTTLAFGGLALAAGMILRRRK